MKSSEEEHGGVLGVNARGTRVRHIGQLVVASESYSKHAGFESRLRHRFSARYFPEQGFYTHPLSSPKPSIEW